MFALALTVFAVFAILVINEFWWRAQTTHGEFNRKFVHITVGSFVAFWPFFLSWNEIRLLSLAFLIIVAVSKYLKVFQAIHSVQRPTWGEFFFAAAVGLVTFFTQDKAIYAAALLQMSLADGLAAVIGVHYGNRLKYLVFGHTKSVVGTLTFFVVSAGILLGFNYFGDTPLTIAYMLVLSATAASIENLAVLGADNLLVPLLITYMITSR